MSTFKVTNRTSTRAKRDINFNSTLDIDFIDDMERKVIKLKPDETIYFTAKSLPLSLHKLRIKELVSVTEVSDSQLSKLQKPKKLQTVHETPKPKRVVVKKETAKKSTVNKSAGRPPATKTEEK
jgi:hypothetical protein